MTTQSFLTKLKRNDQFEYKGTTYNKLAIFKGTSNTVVCQCIKQGTEEKVVIKIIKINEEQKTHLGELKYWQECSLMQSANVVTFEAFEELDEVIIISSFRGIPLAEYRNEIVKRTNGHQFTICTILQILIELVVALQTVHERDLIHRDVSLNNIFMRESFINDIPVISLSLGDFGISVKLEDVLQDSKWETESDSDEEESGFTTEEGTIGYIAPECFQPFGTVSNKSDLWSLGSCILRFLFPDLFVPVNKKQVETIVEKVDELFMQLEKDSKFENESGWDIVRHVLKNTLQNDPSKRWDCSDILKYLFNGYSEYPSLAKYKNLPLDFRKNENLSLLSIEIGVDVLRYSQDFQPSRKVILSALNKEGHSLEYVKDQDREIVLQAVTQHGGSIRYANDTFKKDLDIVLVAVTGFGLAIQYVDELFKKDKLVVLKAVQENTSAFRYIHGSLKSDRDVCLSVVKGKGQGFAFVFFGDESIRKDREIVLEAVKRHGLLLSKVDHIFRKDKEIVLTALRQNVDVINYIDESLKEDVDICQAFSEKKAEKMLRYPIPLDDSNRSFKEEKHSKLECFLNYKDACTSLKKDKHFTIQLLKTNGLLLQYADISLRKDRETVLYAVRQNGLSLKYVNTTLIDDKEIILEAISSHEFALQYASNWLKSDKQFLKQAIKVNGSVVACIDDCLRKDRAFMLEAVKLKRTAAAKYAHESLLNDREFVLEIIKIDAGIISYAGERLLNDRTFIVESMKLNAWIFAYINTFKTDREITFMAVKSDPILLRFSDYSFKNDELIVLEAVRKDGTVLEYASDLMKSNRTITLAAISQNPLAIRYVLVRDEEMIRNAED